MIVHFVFYVNSISVAAAVAEIVDIVLFLPREIPIRNSYNFVIISQ